MQEFSHTILESCDECGRKDELNVYVIGYDEHNRPIYKGLCDRCDSDDDDDRSKERDKTDYKQQAAECAQRLNELSLEDYRDTAWWVNIVDDYDYDKAATDAANPSYMSDVIVWPDGTRVVLDEPSTWQVKEI